MVIFSLSVLKPSALVGLLKKFLSPQKSTLVNNQCLPLTSRPWLALYLNWKIPALSREWLCAVSSKLQQVCIPFCCQLMAMLRGPYFVCPLMCSQTLGCFNISAAEHK